MPSFYRRKIKYKSKSKEIEMRAGVRNTPSRRLGEKWGRRKMESESSKKQVGEAVKGGG